MKLLDLFSGIGGFSLGAEYNNIETIGFVEKDVFCQKVLRKHWPNVPILGDIRDVQKDTFKSVDIVSGGFPCQPFSVAGKRRGTDDDRYLWDETIRVVSLYKPRWFVGENVEGIVNIQNGMVLRQVQDDLEKEGFEVQCGIIPASGIGAWHQRKRVWILGYSQHNGSSTTKEQRGNTQTSTGSQKRENSSLQSKRTSRPTDNGNVSNTHDSRLTDRPQQHQGKSTQEREGQPSSSRQSSVSNTHDSRNRTSRYGSQREGEKNAKEGQNRSQFKSSRHSENDVSKSNSNECKYTSTRESRENKIWGFHTKEKEQTTYDIRSETPRCDVVSGEQEDVSNPNSLRISTKTRNFSQKDGKIQKDGQSNRRNTESISRSFERGDSKKEDVSNSQNRSREQTQWQGRESIGRGSDDRSRLEREGKNIETDVSNSSSERQLHRESGNLGEESRETQGARENNTQGTKDTSARGKQDVSHTNSKGLQGHNSEQQLSKEELRFTASENDERRQSWWEIESSVCTVPNGVSYRLDKNRVNQIKSLGNSIVPQIAYQIFKAIVTVDKEE